VNQLFSESFLTRRCAISSRDNAVSRSWPISRLQQWSRFVAFISSIICHRWLQYVHLNYCHACRKLLNQLINASMSDHYRQHIDEALSDAIRRWKIVSELLRSKDTNNRIE